MNKATYMNLCIHWPGCANHAPIMVYLLKMNSPCLVNTRCSDRINLVPLQLGKVAVHSPACNANARVLQTLGTWTVLPFCVFQCLQVTGEGEGEGGVPKDCEKWAGAEPHNSPTQHETDAYTTRVHRLIYAPVPIPARKIFT